MPRRESTLYFYEQRINKVLNAVSRDPAHAFSLEELGAIACLSPFHLHRVFSAMTGETPGACLRRLRLETAANMLRYSPGRTVTAIAHACGFSSSQNFARMFREWMGETPGRFRAACGQGEPPVPVAQNRKQRNARAYLLEYVVSDGDNAVHVKIVPNAAVLAKGVAMKVEIKDLPAYRVAYVRQTGPYGPGLEKAWNRIAEWAGKNGLLGPNDAALGISWDNPELTPPESCRYDACVVLPESFQADEQAMARSGVSVQRLDAGQYACYRRPTRMDEFFQAWGELFGVWLPQSGYECLGAGFEYYHPPLSCDDNPDLAIDVSFCIPVRRV